MSSDALLPPGPPVDDDQTVDIQTVDIQTARSSWWDGYQVLAIRGLLKLWETFGQRQIWPDTGLRHIVPIYPYGVRQRVSFDLAFMMRQGYVRFASANENCALSQKIS